MSVKSNGVIPAEAGIQATLDMAKFTQYGFYPLFQYSIIPSFHI
jgi:hypothetical protein